MQSDWPISNQSCRPQPQLLRRPASAGSALLPRPLWGSLQPPSATLPATATGVRVSGDPDRVVRRVAVCGGSGDFLLDQLVDEEVDVYVTSDLRHHRASEFLEHNGPALIDVAHWAAEWTWLPVVAGRLEAALHQAGMEGTVSTRVSLTPTDPWTFRI